MACLIYKCKLCDFNCSRLTELCNHYRWHHKKNDKMCKCEKCNKNFQDPSGLGNHIKTCQGVITKRIIAVEYNNIDNKLCEYGCNREAKFILPNGKYCCSENHQSCPVNKKRNSEGLKKAFKEGRAISYFKNLSFVNKKGKPWNCGLTKETSERLMNISKKLLGKSTGIASTKELEEARILKMKETIKINRKTGGYRKGSGRGIKGWYKGYQCDSSWELAYVIYNLEHNIKFERNTKGFEYIYNNKIFKYIPDFILEDGTYVEIKNFINEKFKAKINQFPYNIKILYGEDLKEIFNYIENKYGKDYIKLYEKEGSVA